MTTPSKQPKPMDRRGVALALLVALTVVSILGCSKSDGGKATAKSRASDSTASGQGQSSTANVAPAKVPADPSAGCKQAPETNLHGPTGQDVDVVQIMTSSGVPRTYRLGVPIDDDNKKPHPLIINSHGSGSNAIQQSVYSGIPKAGAAKGYIVVMPDAVDSNWRLFAPNDAAKAPDGVFAKDLIDSLEARFCIDRNRVYASGISLGAAYSADLACAFPDRIAAVGLVAVEVLLKPCPRTLPVLVFHGTADKVVPFAPGEITASKFKGTKTAGTAANMVEWAKLDKCRPEPSVTQAGTEVKHSVWSGCAGQSAVELYAVDGGGHTWPGSPIKVTSLGNTTDQIDATALILDFFALHPLRKG